MLGPGIYPVLIAETETYSSVCVAPYPLGHLRMYSLEFFPGPFGAGDLTRSRSGEPASSVGAFSSAVRHGARLPALWRGAWVRLWGVADGLSTHLATNDEGPS